MATDLAPSPGKTVNGVPFDVLGSPYAAGLVAQVRAYLASEVAA
jgi:hypothetical protein